MKCDVIIMKLSNYQKYCKCTSAYNYGSNMWYGTVIIIIQILGYYSKPFWIVWGQWNKLWLLCTNLQ
jgi:hypothetical protein